MAMLAPYRLVFGDNHSHQLDYNTLLYVVARKIVYTTFTKI